jgi:hypothetical protein
MHLCVGRNKRLSESCSKQVGLTVTPLTRIQEILGSSLGPDIGYSDNF